MDYLSLLVAISRLVLPACLPAAICGQRGLDYTLRLTTLSLSLSLPLSASVSLSKNTRLYLRI